MGKELCDAGEALEQGVQGSCGCHIPGIVRGQVGWGSSERCPTAGDCSQLSPFQPRPFCVFPSLCRNFNWVLLDFFVFYFLI